jgi:uncharacterized protein (TIGR02271 family)
MSTSWDRNDIREGMHVSGTNRKRLGKVIRCNPESFVVEKGMFFPKDYELRYERITDVGLDDITYELSDFDLRVGGGGEATRLGLAATAAAHASTRAARANGAPARPAARAAADREIKGGLGERQELHVPLMEEEVGVEKVARETGHLRIHKTVKIEEKHFTVPVAREDVVIERITATSEEPMLPSESAFQEQTLDLPLYEEEVRVTKRSRVREEMVVRTIVQAVEKEAAATLRHEEAEIEDTRSATERRTDTAPAIPSVYGAPGRDR